LFAKINKTPVQPEETFVRPSQQHAEESRSGIATHSVTEKKDSVLEERECTFLAGLCF
jgi:hypothetical protein